MRRRRFIVAALGLRARDIGSQGSQLLAQQVYLALQREHVQLLRCEGVAELAQRVSLERDLGLEGGEPLGSDRVGTAAAVVTTRVAPG